MNTHRLKLGYILAGFLALLIGAYMDSIRGPLLPILADALSLRYDRVSWILIAGNLTAIPCLLYLPALIEKLGDRKTLFALCFFGLLCLGLSFGVSSFMALLVLGCGLGVVLAIAGTHSNLLVMEGAPPRLRHRLLCALHTMYSVGSFLASVVVSWGIRSGLSWQWMLATSGVGIAALLGTAYAGIGATAEIPPKPESNKISLWQLFLLVGFCCYIAGEVTITMWMVAFLVEDQGMGVDLASNYLGGFFSIMALTRILCFLSLPPKATPFICLSSLAGSLVFFILGYQGWLWGLCLAGILGPFFPLYLGLLSEGFPTQWRRMTVWLIVGVQISLGLSHILLGKLTASIGIRAAYCLPIALMLLAGASVLIYFRKTLRQISSIQEVESI